MEKKTRGRMKTMMILLIVIGGIFLVNKLNIFQGYSPADMKEHFQSFGLLAPIIYILVFTLVTLTLFPESIVVIAAGMAFGLLEGFIYSMMGAMCGATLSFYISKVLGKNFIRSFMKKDISSITDKLEGNGFFIIFLLRLIPLFPFDVVSYGGGLSNIKYKDFMMATFLGIMPGVLVYANLGAQSMQIGSTGFYVSVALLILLFVSSIFLKRKFTEKKINKAQGKEIRDMR